MKSTFFFKQINSPFHDPVVMVRFRREKKAFLFDLGDISGLSVRQALKITHVFVTHMHVDHFIGFDRLVRCLLNRAAPLHVFGPEGILKAVQNSLGGFTWNLVRDYPFRMEVCEIRADVHLRAGFYATEGFSRIDHAPSPASEKVISTGGITLSACIFDHGIPVLGFSLAEDSHINIDGAALERKGLVPGPWLAAYKTALREGRSERVFTVGGRQYPMENLSGLAFVTKGQKMAYITDISPTDENLRAAVELAEGADMLFIEAYFLDEDIERARARNHLTAKLSGRIARLAGVGDIALIHISPKYAAVHEQVVGEVFKEFTAKGNP
jgi:ribonuclease Z